MTETTKPQNDTAQERQERRLRAAKRLLTNADTDAAVVEYCRAVLDPPGYERSHTQARLDACAARLALAQTDTTTKRTREARRVLPDRQRRPSMSRHRPASLDGRPLENATVSITRARNEALCTEYRRRVTVSNSAEYGHARGLRLNTTVCPHHCHGGESA
ncbi:hypothetical protein [Haloarcula sebkhae]|nr:hypothetical protein [Haloarcula sebkhae]